MPHDPADRSPLAAAAEALLKAMQAGGYIDGRIYNDVGRVEAALFADAAWLARAEAVWLPTHQHREGGYYRLLFLAVHTETEEAFAIYDDQFGKVWARPRAMFEDGRFALLSDAARRRYKETCRAG